MSVALFPSDAQMKAEDMEPELRDMRLSTGEKVKVYSFNKGL